MITFYLLFFGEFQKFHRIVRTIFDSRDDISYSESILFFCFSTVDTTCSLSNSCIDITETNIMIFTASFSKKSIKSLSGFMFSNDYLHMGKNDEKNIIIILGMFSRIVQETYLILYLIWYMSAKNIFFQDIVLQL